MNLRLLLDGLKSSPAIVVNSEKFSSVEIDSM
jgi:hypothetical protein